MQCTPLLMVTLAGIHPGIAMANGPGDVRVTITARDEPVQTVLDRISRAAHVNFSLSRDVSGFVTVSLRALGLTDALHAVLDPLGLQFSKSGSVLTIVSRNQSKGGQQVVNAPTVFPLAVLSSPRAVEVLHALFPGALIREIRGANAVAVTASETEMQSIRGALQGLDVPDARLPTSEVVNLRVADAREVARKLSAVLPGSKIEAIGNHQLLVSAAGRDMSQLKAMLNNIDPPNVQPIQSTAASEAVRISQRPPKAVANVVASQISNIRVSVAGSTVVLTGAPEQIARAKALISQIDVPNYGERFVQIYRIRNVDATSVAGLITRSIPGISVEVDRQINAITVNATGTVQTRIAESLALLDVPVVSASSAGTSQAFGSSSGSEVITLKSFVPGQSQGSVDAVASITQAVGIVAPDVKVAQLPTPGQIVLIGPSASVASARSFIEKIDVVPPLVVLDTEILEVDESVAKNLGLQLGSSVLSTTYSEQTTPSSDGTVPRLGRFQALSRSPIQFTALLNLLVQKGQGRVLADPRITTLSGRTASIRAGDTISILTTTSGNAGTIASTQVQSFQTGVTLDITPSVTPDGGVMVTLHPIVNSLIGTNNGVPEISTRDTQTTVHLQDDETLVIGGLIQENETRTTTKLPFLGDIPLLGRLFRNDNVQNQRNELVIVVTPHVVKPSSTTPAQQSTNLATPRPLPTLPSYPSLPQATRTQTPQAEPRPRVGTPSTNQATPTPAESPTPFASSDPAFAQTNVFVFGSPPQSNYAKKTDSVQIFYATLSPTVIRKFGTMRIAVITTTNAASVKLSLGASTTALTETAPGQWQATIPSPVDGSSSTRGPMTATLVANRGDGISASLPISVNFAP